MRTDIESMGGQRYKTIEYLKGVIGDISFYNAIQKVPITLYLRINIGAYPYI